MKKTGATLILLGLAMTVLAVYQAHATSQIKVVAWYDMNGDGVINFNDFDLNDDGTVSWVDVTMVTNAVGGTYVERYDFNRDAVVDETDVDIITAWMGKGRMALYDMNNDDVVDWRDLDVNNDGVIDIFDISTVARAYGSSLGDGNYNPRVDFNQDGVIDDADLNLITPYYGYPLSTVEILTNPANPISQLFISGLIIAILGLITTFRGR